MERGPEQPEGFEEGYPLETDVPGADIVMLAVFTGVGWELQSQYPLREIDSVVFFVGVVIVAVMIEGVHEWIHKLAFAVQGIEATIYWRRLSVIPSAGFVSRRSLCVTAIAPFVILTLLIVGVFAAGMGRLVTVMAGIGFAVNSMISVLDVAVLLKQLSVPKGSLFSFQRKDNSVDVWVFEPSSKPTSSSD